MGSRAVLCVLAAVLTVVWAVAVAKILYGG